MLLDEVERSAGLELRLHHDGAAEQMMQRAEHRHSAVIAGSADEMHVLCGELKDRDHLHHVLDVDTVRAPGSFRMPRGAGRVDHRRSESGDLFWRRRRILRCGIHQLRVGQPSRRHALAGSQVADVAGHLRARCLHGIDVRVVGHHDERTRIVHDVGHLAPAQPVVDRSAHKPRLA